MPIPILSGLAGVAGDYDLFILDLWGVVHDGEAVFPGAVDCLQRLRRRGARVVLLSNAARLSDSVAAHLVNLGVTPDLYDQLLTSGDVTAKAIAAGASGSGRPIFTLVRSVAVPRWTPAAAVKRISTGPK